MISDVENLVMCRWPSVFSFGENFVKMTILLKAVNRLNSIPIKIPMALFTEKNTFKILNINTKKSK